MEVRIHIVVDEEVDKKFRDKFIRRKGDYSKKINELMEASLKC